MTDLSPAAQSVLDAFENASDGEYVEGVWIVDERTMLAAALRVAADCLPIQPLTREPPDQFEMGLSQGQALSRAEILAIAAELEAQ
jgi:hypothetical protein